MSHLISVDCHKDANAKKERTLALSIRARIESIKNKRAAGLLRLFFLDAAVVAASASRLQLRASGDESLAGLVVLVLHEVLDEALS